MKRIISLIAMTALLICTFNFCVVPSHGDEISSYAASSALQVSMPRVDADAIVVDGVKDLAYDYALRLDCKYGNYCELMDILDGTVYLTYDTDYLYAFYEILDGTVDSVGDYAWEADCAELWIDFNGGTNYTQYRVDRDGTLSDGNGNTGDALTLEFEGAATEMTNGNGYYVEMAIPMPAGSADVMGIVSFVNDKGSGKYAYIGNGPANTIIKMGADVVSDEFTVVYDAEPVTMTTGAAVALMPDGAIDVNRDTRGVTYWFRIEGLNEPLTLSSPTMDISTKHYEPVFIYEEDGVTNKRDEFGNKMVEKDENGNVIFVSEDMAIDFNLRTYNHGHDGM